MFWKDNILVRHSNATLRLELIVCVLPHLICSVFLHSFQTFIHFSHLFVCIWEASFGLNFPLFKDLKLVLWPRNFSLLFAPEFLSYHLLCLYLEVVQLSTIDFERYIGAYTFVHLCCSVNTHIWYVRMNRVDTLLSS